MEGRKEWKEGKRKGKGKGKRKRMFFVSVRQIYEIEHDKDYAGTYKMYMPINLIIQKLLGIINPF